MALAQHDQTNADVIDDWHRARGFHRADAARKRFNPSLTSIGYHWVIAPNGFTESGRHVEQLGWPEIDIAYRPGSRYPTGAVMHLAERGRQPFDVNIELLGGMALNVGCGYGADPDWNHGRWMGRGYVANAVYDMADAAVAGRVGWAPIDFVARATQVGGSHDGAVGYGIFEHMSIGRHDPSGMADLMSVAP